jgi:hypothetical protein
MNLLKSWCEKKKKKKKKKKGTTVISAQGQILSTSHSPPLEKSFSL